MNTQTQEALKMAIEMLEKLSYEYGRLLDGDQEYGLLPSEINADIIKAYYVKRTCQEALEQPAPKNCTPLDEYIAEMEKDPEIKQLLDIAREDVKKWSTQPSPAPSWQGLSDDEIQNVCGISKDGNYWDLCLDIARAVEQALKEKNHA